MGGWRLQPGVIGAVLADVEAELEAMNAAWSQDRLESVLEDLGAVGPAGADVRTAVVGVLNGQGGRLSTMGARVSAGLIGVESATACYQAGQEEMLGQVQTQMLASAASGDFSWWYASSLPAGAV